MPKSLWITAVLLLLVAIGAPSVQASSFTYSYTIVINDEFSLGWTTSPGPAVTTNTSITAGSLASSSVSGALSGQTLNSVDLDPASTPITGCPTGDCVASFLSGTSGTTEVLFSNLTATDFDSPGTYTFTGTTYPLVETFVVKEITTAMPEPPTYGLTLTGIGLVLAMRRRIGQGLPQAG